MSKWLEVALWWLLIACVGLWSALWSALGVVLWVDVVTAVAEHTGPIPFAVLAALSWSAHRRESEARELAQSPPIARAR